MSPITSTSEPALPKGSLVLITGATGFIGANTVQEALDAGNKVRGTSRTEQNADKTKKIFSNNENLTIAIVPDVSVPGAWDEAVKGVSAIIHMATDVSFSPDPNIVVSATEAGVRNLLRSAAAEPSVKRVVFTSSSAAFLPRPNERFTIGKDAYAEDAVAAAWAPPPYTADRAYPVYAASKVAAEKAFGKFIEAENPSFVGNSVLPNFNVGRIITSGSPTGSSVEGLLNGNIPPFPPQYHIDVVDTARLHLIAAVLDSSLKNERIFAFARPFTFTEMIKDLEELRPDVKTLASPPENEGQDMSIVPNELGAELLRQWYGQDGYKTMRTSIEEALASLKI